MLNELRQELQMMLIGTECVRPPVLRRSLREDFLYATDLPQAADEDAVRSFIRRAQDSGWHTETEKEWIQLDPCSDKPYDTGFRGPFGAEARSCASLLRRHPDGQPGDRERRMLIKAGEEGPEMFEKTCALLHREWASALRKGDKLPGIPNTFFTGGKET